MKATIRTRNLLRKNMGVTRARDQREGRREVKLQAGLYMVNKGQERTDE